MTTKKYQYFVMIQDCYSDQAFDLLESKLFDDEAFAVQWVLDNITFIDNQHVEPHIYQYNTQTKDSEDLGALFLGDHKTEKRRED